MISGWHGEIPEDSGYFHAVYRQEHPVQKGRSYTVLDNVEVLECLPVYVFLRHEWQQHLLGRRRDQDVY